MNKVVLQTIQTVQILGDLGGWGGGGGSPHPVGRGGSPHPVSRDNEEEDDLSNFNFSNMSSILKARSEQLISE